PYCVRRMPWGIYSSQAPLRNAIDPDIAHIPPGLGNVAGNPAHVEVEPGSVATQAAQRIEPDRQLLEEDVEVVAGAQVLGQPAQRVDGTLERLTAVVE